MGAADYLPYAHTKNGLEVAVWNGAHTIVDHTTGASVVCELNRPNGLWYKLPTPADLRPDDPDQATTPVTGRYLSAALTNLSGVPDGWMWGACPDNADQPGRRFPDRPVMILGGAVALGLLLAARAMINRRRPSTTAGRPPA